MTTYPFLSDTWIDQARAVKARPGGSRVRERPTYPAIVTTSAHREASSARST